MEELLPRALADVADSLLCNAILEVGIDTTKGKSLSLCTATLLECIVRKASIFAVVVKDVDAMLLGEVLKHAHSIHRLFRGEHGHQMDVLELRVVVKKTVGAVYCFLVSDTFSGAMKPTCVDFN
jgi:hypothetical protein